MAKPKWVSSVTEGVMMRRDQRGNVERLYTVVWNATRSIVWAHSYDDAFNRWVTDAFTIAGTTTRFVAPLRREVIVRYADTEEQVTFGRRRKRVRRRTQADALFDVRALPTKHDARIGSEGTLPGEGSRSPSKRRKASGGTGQSDPVLERRLRDAGRLLDDVHDEEPAPKRRD